MPRLFAAEPTAQQIEFFEKSVRPVLVDTCYKCHGAEKQKGGLRVDSREALLKGGGEGPAIVVGQPDKSLLIKAVRHEGELQMPEKGGKLSNTEIEALVAWVKMGAPWPEARVEIGGGRTEEKKHWAFQPVAKPAIPKVRNGKWAQNEIDAFVLAKLEAKKMSPAPSADRRALIRRAYYDLIGLPPSYEEVETFVADKSPDAFARVVDRLLASPRFGERWGRYWLDVARYADTKGYVFQEERRYPYAYTYRDWVIRALNEDLPYDKFLVQQIAADKLPQGGDKQSLAAMGFLTVGRRFLNQQPDIIDDRIDVITRGTMALTVSCARCHDHKYDPIPTRDYYSLYGVFASSVEPKDLPLIGEPQRTEAYLAFERELQKREAEVNMFVEKRHKEILASLRKPEPIAAYLLAWRDTRGKNEDELKGFIRGRDLNPYMFGRWKAYLNGTNASHPIFGPWHKFAALADADFMGQAPALAKQFAANADSQKHLNPVVANLFATAPPKSLAELAKHYGEMLARNKLPDQKTIYNEVTGQYEQADELKDADLESIRQVLIVKDAPLDVPQSDAPNLFDRADRDKLNELKKKVEEWKATSLAAPPRAMVLADSPNPRDVNVFKRGNPSNPGDVTPRRFLEVLSREPRKPFANGSGRLELAQAIASRDNPLTARVMVNRVWLHLFGAGLVRTPSDFGTRSEPPSHPELLDHLSTHFVENGWSVKKLIRQIMFSATYQQSSEGNPKYTQLDVENTLLWKQNRQRLDFEAMRDSLLSAAGQLDLTMGGQPADIILPSTKRRSVYGFIERQNLPGIFRTFDFASPDTHSPQRFHTTVPQQALFMMNSPFVIEQARALAQKSAVRSQSSEDRIQDLYRRAHGRAPSKDEIKFAQQFIQSASPAFNSQPSTPNPWHYGYGFHDEKSKKVNFTPLPHWTDTAWQGGPNLPDQKLGWVLLNADGGHPGNDAQHAAIRRWIAPADLVVDIRGKLEQPSPQGDGIRAYVVSSRGGELARWTIAPAKSVDTIVARVEVKKGDTIDFIVDCNGNLSNDTFVWTFRLKDITNPIATANPMRWNAKDDFHGPLPTSLSAWEKLAQVLLLANEFVFVD